MNSNLIASSDIVAVIGMGVTGLSVARYLGRQNKKFIMFDTREQPGQLPTFLREFPDRPYQLGPLDFDALRDVSKIVLSPGLAANDPALRQADQHGIPIVGDIQLFAEHVAAEESPAPVVAITGSNAKSTVTTLVGAMAERAGLRTKTGGNLAPPALDLLDVDNEKTELFVLEVSSFQLETTHNLGAEVATILNVSSDHMDRYSSLQAYHAAKQRIFQQAKAVVINREDPLTQPLLHQGMRQSSFGLDRPDLNQFGITSEAGKEFLSRGTQELMAAEEVKMVGRHNLANALAALAIGEQLALPMDAMLDTLREFPGLNHRCEWVASHRGVDYVNDSKGTNVGATLAALTGLSRLPKKIVLIAGGDGKGGNFEDLKREFNQQLKGLVVMGKDAPQLAAVASQIGVKTQLAENMQQAVSVASSLAGEGDLVLLSPACASLDMFANYQDRGDQFKAAVHAMASEGER